MATYIGKQGLWAVATVVGLLAAAVAIQQVVLSYKFGSLELRQPPLLALLTCSAGIAAASLRHATTFGRLSAQLLGQASICAIGLAAVFAPGSPLPFVIAVVKPWGAFLVAGALTAAAGFVLRRQVILLHPEVSLFQVAATSSACIALSFSVLGYTLWQLIFPAA